MIGHYLDRSPCLPCRISQQPGRFSPSCGQWGPPEPRKRQPLRRPLLLLGRSRSHVLRREGGLSEGATGSPSPTGPDASVSFVPEVRSQARGTGNPSRRSVAAARVGVPLFTSIRGRRVADGLRAGDTFGFIWTWVLAPLLNVRLTDDNFS